MNLCLDEMQEKNVSLTYKIISQWMNHFIIAKHAIFNSDELWSIQANKPMDCSKCKIQDSIAIVETSA